MSSWKVTVILKFCLVLDSSVGWQEGQDHRKSLLGGQVLEETLLLSPERVVLTGSAGEPACVRGVVAWDPQSHVMRREGGGLGVLRSPARAHVSGGTS